MMHHHQRFYQYGGPPSIVMGTWGDRKSSRSTFAPPPAPFAIPPAGVPGGRMGPAPPPPTSRMSAGYHSLQYTPQLHHHHEQHPIPNMPPSVIGHPVQVLEHQNNNKKGSSSAKYTRDGSDHHHHHQIHKLPQVNNFFLVFCLYLEKKVCYVIRNLTVHYPNDAYSECM